MAKRSGRVNTFDLTLLAMTAGPPGRRDMTKAFRHVPGGFAMPPCPTPAPPLQRPSAWCGRP
jgi:hypothetical protein